MKAKVSVQKQYQEYLEREKNQGQYLINKYGDDTYPFASFVRSCMNSLQCDFNVSSSKTMIDMFLKGEIKIKNGNKHISNLTKSLNNNLDRVELLYIKLIEQGKKYEEEAEKQ